MTDIEFLLNPKPVLRKVCFFIYEHAYLKPEVLSKVKTIAGEDLRTPQDFSTDVKIPSLFGERHYFLQVSTKEELKALCLALKNISEDKVFISCPGTLFEDLKEEFKQAQKIIETEKTKSNFPAVLEYLFTSTKHSLSLLQKLPIIQQQLELLYNKTESLPEFLLKAEQALFTCLSEKDGLWDSKLFNIYIQQKENVKYFELHENLYFFISRPSIETKDFLYQFLAKSFLDIKESRAILSNIYRAVMDICMVNKYLSEKKTDSEFKNKMLQKYSDISLINLMKFSVTLSQKEKELNSSEFLSALHAFLQNCLGYFEK